MYARFSMIGLDCPFAGKHAVYAGLWETLVEQPTEEVGTKNKRMRADHPRQYTTQGTTYSSQPTPADGGLDPAMVMPFSLKQ